ncbi:MAG TPA: DUF4388 domain-containing protein [Desulfuromonadaceae bacterium]|jgi:hypothetical protein
MSFAGDLEHLPIVDIIQLLHSTRKTGTLCLKSSKGESQLVFNDGYFVSANHVNNSVRIGQILVEMKAINQEELDTALLEQKNAGSGRKPLVATLIEQGTIKKEDAYKGLEELIEMTIVEVLTWKSGTFSLDVSNSEVSDEYRYFPETLQQEIFMNAQSILMDALRIYDEKMRDGTLSEVFFSTPETSENKEYTEGTQSITADILGLDNLDALKKNIPSVFIGLKDHDPLEEHRRVIGEELGEISREESDKLCSILSAFSKQASVDINHQNGPTLAIVLYSRDIFITHVLKSVCRHEKIFVFNTDEEVNLNLIIEQSLSRDLKPILVIDSSRSVDGETGGDADIALIKNKKERFPQISIIHTIFPPDHESSLQLFEAGVQAILPRPCQKEHKGTFVDDTINFLCTFQSYLRSFVSCPNNQQIVKSFKDCMVELETLMQPPEVAALLLGFVSSMFERSITFVVGKMELIAERGIGVKADKSTGPTPPMMFKIPLENPSIFKEVIGSGRLHYGNVNDPLLDNSLFEQIGRPYSSKTLFFPIKSFGRVIAIIYADFGNKTSMLLPIDLLDILVSHTSLVLDHAFYRKRFEKPAQSQ